MPHISVKKREGLIRDIVAGKLDLAALAASYGLNEEDVAGWMTEPQTRKVLSGLCTAADFQTQMLLSRYRALAASRLLTLASGGEGGEEVSSSPSAVSGREGAAGNSGTGPGAGPGAEVSRKACVDLLKLELKRTSGELAAGPGDAEDEIQAQALREMLYGKAEEVVK